MTTSTTAQTYAAPTPAQLAAAQAWVAAFAANWERPDPEGLRPLMHEDTRNLIPPMTQPGDREAVVAHFRGVLQMLPDFRLSILRWAPVADTVMIEWEGQASVGGQPLTWRGVDRISLRNGKTYEGQVYWDTRRVAEMVAEAIAKGGQA